MIFRSRTLPEFGVATTRCLSTSGSALPDPRHPSLQLKPVGEFWSARVNDAYRALAVREGNIFTLFWIGPHDEYERIING